jgi:hypothetical protein
VYFPGSRQVRLKFPKTPFCENYKTLLHRSMLPPHCFRMFRLIFFVGVLFAGLSSTLTLAFAQERCKPLLPVDLPGTLPCAANIIGGNGPEEMNPPKAIEQAREVLWDHFIRRVPSFLNLEVASKEGARTRVVYVLEQTSSNESLVLRRVLQREMIDVMGQTAQWGPVESFRATTVIRDETTGALTFKNGADVIAHL